MGFFSLLFVVLLNNYLGFEVYKNGTNIGVETMEACTVIGAAVELTVVATIATGGGALIPNGEIAKRKDIGPQ